MKLYPLPALILCLTVLLSAQVDPTLLQNLGNNSSSMGAFATMENSDKQALLEAFFLSDTFSGLSSQNKFKNDSLSPLFLHPDSALIIPFDTIHTAKDSQTSTQHLRFSRRIFHTIDPSVFSSATNAVSPSYPIKPGDQLVVSSWGETEFEQEVLVNNQGSFFLKNIGLIPVAGLTLAQAQQAVTLRMSKHYSSIKRNRTQVNVRLSKLSPIKVFIMGQVQKPGAYMFYGNTSVLQALYFAQGPTDIGSVRNIIVKRDSTEFTFDLYEYLFAGNTTPPTILLDGDVIILPRASILVAAYGDIGDQGIFELTPQEGLKHLLQYSSGINPTAGRENIQIQRINELGAYDHEQIALSKILQDSSFTFNMQDGDIVFIPTSSFTGTMNVTIQGAVAYPGTYKYSQGQTAMDLIRTAGSLQEHAYADRLQVIRSDAEGNQELFSFTLNTAQQFALSHQDTLIVYSKKQMNVPDSVSISGAVFKPGMYAYFSGMNPKDLVLLAGGFLPERKQGALRLDRKDGRKANVQSLQIGESYTKEPQSITLQPWDHLEVPFDPEFQKPAKVKLRGAFMWPGTYVLQHPDETLKDLITRAGGFKAEAYKGGGRFYRKFPAQSGDTLQQIGVNLPKALSNDKYNNIPLQDGDSVYVPTKWVSVKVSGEVGYPNNVLYKAGKSPWYYIDKAGGLTRLSDKERIRVKYANGEVSPLSNLDRDPDPGAEIIVPHKPEDPPINWVRALSATASVLTSMATFIVAWVALQRLD